MGDDKPPRHKGTKGEWEKWERVARRELGRRKTAKDDKEDNAANCFCCRSSRLLSSLWRVLSAGDYVGAGFVARVSVAYGIVGDINPLLRSCASHVRPIVLARWELRSHASA
jgi:hypothetical protein